MGCTQSSGGNTAGAKSPHNKFAVVVDVARARNVKQMDVSSKSDVYVMLVCGGQKLRTTTFGDNDSPVWNASFMFRLEKKPDQLSLVALDEDVLWDDTIGRHNVDLAPYFARSSEQQVWEWLPLTSVDRRGSKINGELEVRIRAFSLEANDSLAKQIEHLEYTHLLEVTVESARDLPRMDAVSENDNYVRVGWGTKSFSTYVVRGQAPRWRQRVYFWADVNSQSEFKLLLELFDQDPQRKQDERVGTVYVDAKDVFAHDGESLEKWYALKKAFARSDRTLRQADDVSQSPDQAPSEADGVAGPALRVGLRMQPREEVLKSFFAKIVSEFDASGDGKLQRSEVESMIGALGVSMSPELFDQFWVAVDPEGTGEVAEDKAGQLLRALLFVDDATANQVMAFLEGGVYSLRKSLMRPTRLTRDGKGEIPVMDRVTGLVVPEYIPTYIKVALAALFDSRTGRAVARGARARKTMLKMSVRQGEKFDDPESANDIPDFVALHKLNLDEVDGDLSSFRTFNQFFYRGLKPAARPVASPDVPGVLVSPADCRMMVFPDVHSSHRYWIKGSDFTLEALLGRRGAELAPRYREGSLLIARLAPQDYHRYHYAVGGRVLSREPIDGALYTVNPIAVNSSISVYTENKRVVEEIETEEYGLVVAVCIGATMVGSIHFFQEPGAVVRKGDQHGYFAFGGSTVLYLFEKGRVSFDADLVANSSKAVPVETLVRVNTKIGVAHVVI